MKKAVEWGVTFWDTSHMYEGGHSELGIGQYIAKNPEMRKQLFIVSKASGACEISHAIALFSRCVLIPYRTRGLETVADLMYKYTV